MKNRRDKIRNKTKPSSKAQKNRDRLREQFVNRQLRKEERSRLLQSLAASQNTSVALQPSARLGSKRQLPVYLHQDTTQESADHDALRSKRRAKRLRRKLRKNGQRVSNNPESLPDSPDSSDSPESDGESSPEGESEQPEVESEQSGVESESGGEFEVSDSESEPLSENESANTSESESEGSSQNDSTSTSESESKGSSENKSEKEPPTKDHSLASGFPNTKSHPVDISAILGSALAKPKTEKKSSFKEWAEANVSKAGLADTDAASDTAAAADTGAARSQTSNQEITPPTAQPPLPLNRAPRENALSGTVDEPELEFRTHAVRVNRTDAVASARLALPIVQDEDRVLQTIQGHPVTVICGETGSGKTTQIGQFLWEAGFGYPGGPNPGKVAITQPRRVAALSTCARVKEELGLPAESPLVGHRIRFQSNVDATTRLLFMTDGVLLRELASDLLLSKYSVIVIDEAHERSVNTDILIGMLSRVVRLRLARANEKKGTPLRLVIMSATIRVADFVNNTTLFTRPPPLLRIDARQFPVTMHFSRSTAPNYIQAAYDKIVELHRETPVNQGFLVFCTGQDEITTLIKKLATNFENTAASQKQTNTLPTISVENLDLELDDFDTGGQGELDIRDDSTQRSSSSPMHVLPLYSLLPSEQQLRVFQDPPQSSRLVVISTNVAETSLTIPNVKHVIDTGRAKQRSFDATTGISSFDVSWISKAAATQRAGRAGRTGPGHCHRLYSSNVYEDFFPDHTPPEILRMPVDSVVLQMKAMMIDRVINFPFPTPPLRSSLRAAETSLTRLGALSQGKDGMCHITDLGHAMALLPLPPRLAKLAVIADNHGCLPYVLLLVSALSVGPLFQDPDHLPKDARSDYYKKMSKLCPTSADNATSDVFAALGALGAYEYELANGRATLESFSRAFYLRSKALSEIFKMRAQLENILRTASIFSSIPRTTRPPSPAQLTVIRQLLAAVLLDNVAVRKDLLVSDVPSYAHAASSHKVPYRGTKLAQDLVIHPSSALYRRPPPKALVYLDAVERDGKVSLKGLTVVDTTWLAQLGYPEWVHDILV